MSLIEKECEKKHSNGHMKKFWIILSCILVLLIPLNFFENTVNERESYKDKVVAEIAKSWATAQTIGAPELLIENGKKDNKGTLENYDVKANLTVETRKKGIFKVPVYTADVEMRGTFAIDKNHSGKTFFINHITDSKGFVNEPMLKIGGSDFVRLNSDKFAVNTGTADKVPFILKYKIRGLNELKIRAKGKNNTITAKGNWADPSFNGDFLPLKRTVTKDGFDAEWSVPEAASLSSGEFSECVISMLVPVDSYRMVQRAVKYGFLFLSLTFLTFFVYEITSKDKRKIHPLQYILIGMAMCIFYLLLLSMSEFIPFFAAYLIATVMTVSLIGAYTYNVITKKQNITFSAIIVTILALLYAFLYVLLMLQDFSLILGSIGTFVIIALIMYATKDVEWYKEEPKEE